MASTDEAVLRFIGRDGASVAALAERFPEFDVERLVRAHLVEASVDAETEAHCIRASTVRYVLTPRGAEAVGLVTSRSDTPRGELSASSPTLVRAPHPLDF